MNKTTPSTKTIYIIDLSVMLRIKITFLHIEHLKSIMKVHKFTINALQVNYKIMIMTLCDCVWK